MFKLDGRFFRCIALPFGWCLSPAYFIKIMCPFVQYVRHYLGLHIHPYMDDFLVATGPSTALPQARSAISTLLSNLRLLRKEGKGCWEGGTRIDHLGFTVDTEKMTFGINTERLLKLHDLSRSLLNQAHRNRRLVKRSQLRHFCGVAVFCSLAMRLSRFHTRSLYDSMNFTSKTGSRVRLSHAALRNLKTWRGLQTSPSSRSLHKRLPTLALHSDDSTSAGLGGTLGRDLRPGQPGTWKCRGLWHPVHRVKPITLLELKAVTHNLRAFSQQLHRHQSKVIKVWEDNQAVGRVLNTMTSKSPALMMELRVIHKVLVRLGISIDSHYLPSAVNRFADRLSRLQSLDNWRINQVAIAPLLKTLPPTMDRFADY